MLDSSWPQHARYRLPWNPSVLATRSVLQAVSSHLRSPGDAWANRQMCSCVCTTVTVPGGDPAKGLHPVLVVGVEAWPVAHEAVELRDEGRQRRELAEVVGEGVEEEDGGVRVALQEEEALGGVEDAVVGEQREAGGHEGARAAVEEADAAAEPGVARVQAVALGEHRPPPRVEAGSDTPRPRGSAVQERQWRHTARKRT